MTPDPISRHDGHRPANPSSADSKGDPTLKPEYFEAWFHCPEPPHPLPERLGIVTPCNPFGRTLPADQNAYRLGQLAAQLTAQGVAHFRADGGSLDGRHLEAGFGIIGMPLTELRQLGNQFGQDAVFWVEQDQVWLVSCQSGESRLVCRWSERQASPGR